MIAPYYLVGQKQIQNQFHAWREIIRSNEDFRFVCFEDIYDTVDWTKEPEESWDEICQNKCDLLRQKYSKLSLFYSAGRDSHHILSCFNRFKIPLDQLILIEPPLQPSKYHEFVNYILPMARQYQILWPQCKIKVIKFDANLFDHYFKDDWLDAPSMTLTQGLFNPVQFGWLTEHALKAEPNHGVIVGLEKPRIILEDGKLYSVILDKSVEIFLSHNQNFELFYYSPDYPKVHVKQTWMMLNYILHNFQQVTSELLHNFCANSASIYYDAFCQSCGRGPAWNANLDLQNGKNKYQLNGLDPKIQNTLTFAQQNHWKAVDNYTTALNWLQKTMPQAFNNFDPRSGTVGIWGKKYFMKSL